MIGLVALDLAGLAAPSGRMLLCAPVAAGHWTLTAAALAGAVALALACIGRRRDRCQTRSGPEPGPGIAPGADRARSRAARRSPGRVTRSIMGKLTAVANRIVDRGELCVCPVKERRCQSTLSS